MNGNTGSALGSGSALRTDPLGWCTRLLVLASAAAVFTGLLGGTALASYPYWQVNTAYSGYTALNLRTGPGTNYGVITSIPHGTWVKGTWDYAYGPSPYEANSLWRYVYYNGTWGWSFDEGGGRDSLLGPVAYWDPPYTNTYVSPASPTGTYGWYNTIPTVSLGRPWGSATQWNWDWGPTGTYWGPFYVPEGNHTVYAQSMDDSGIWGSWTSMTLHVDVSPPTNPSVTAGSRAAGVPGNDPTLTLTWSGASDAVSGVRGYAFSVTSGPNDSPGSDVQSASSYTTRVPDGTYYFHLRTVDWAGNWAGSVVNAGPFLVDTTGPTTSTLSTVSVTTTTVALSWTAAADGVSGVSCYGVYASGGALVATTTATSYIATGLAPGATYGFYVRSTDGAGNMSAPSNSVTGTTQSQAASVTPTSYDFGAVPIGGSTSTTVTVSNTGGSPLTISGLTPAGAGISVASPPTLPVVVPAGASTNLSLAFAPSLSGAVSGSLVIATDDPAHPTLTVALTGTGITSAGSLGHPDLL